jgi:phenylacetate-CoA ligase
MRTQAVDETIRGIVAITITGAFSHKPGSLDSHGQSVHDGSQPRLTTVKPALDSRNQNQALTAEGSSMKPVPEQAGNDTTVNRAQHGDTGVWSQLQNPFAALMPEPLAEMLSPPFASALPDPLAMIPADPLSTMMLGADDFLRWSLRCASTWSSTQAGEGQIEALRRQRLAALLTHARKHSPLIRELLTHLPDDAPLEDLPILGRERLMADFDRWVTDPQVRLEGIRAFISDPARAGEPYLGRYAVWTSSGTSGVPGIYVTDPDALAVCESLSSMRSACGCAASPLWQAMTGSCRIAMVAATTGHFAGFVTWERMRRLHPWLAVTARTFSILDPIEQLVDELNAWQPMLVSSYPSLLALLARERRSGRLKIAPQLLMSGGETLPASQARWLEDSFACPVRDEYGASECMNIAWSCDEGMLHLNADWVILEPVDEHGRPVPIGAPSADVLLTNLGNHVQPILRYPLGDRVTMLAGRCECGCPLPRLRVSGRHDDVLHLPDRSGRPVAILPLALETLIEEQGGIGAFQVEQTAADQLAIRLHTGPAEDRQAIWSRLEQRIIHWLDLQGVQAGVRLDRHRPMADPHTGKLRRVIALKHAAREGRQHAHDAGPGRVRTKATGPRAPLKPAAPQDGPNRRRRRPAS